MPRSCRSMCMVAASTSYKAHADPVPAATAARQRPCGTTGTGEARSRSKKLTGLELGDMVAATIRERLRTEGAVVNGEVPAPAELAVVAGSTSIIGPNEPAQTSSRTDRAVPASRTAAPVHLCPILRFAYHKSQKTIISPQEGRYAVLASRNLLYVPLGPEPGLVISGWLCSPTCAGPRGPAGARRSHRRGPPAPLVIGIKQLKGRGLPDAEC